MADFIRYGDRWTYLTIRVPADRWRRYQASFDYWPEAVGGIRVAVLHAMMAKSQPDPTPDDPFYRG